MRLKSLPAYSIFLHLVLIALAVQVVFLVKENRRLLEGGRLPQIATGERLPPISARQLDGQDTTLHFASSSEDTLLLVFTTTCPVCEKNQPAWRELYERFGDHYNVVGLSIGDVEPTRAYASEHDLPFPVFVPEDAQDFPKRFKIPAVPQTLHLDRDGIVRDQWAGPLPRESFDKLAASSLGRSSTLER